MQKLKSGAIILSNDSTKILLVYRGKEADWSFPKGHIEENEIPVDAMKREVKEETGLEVATVITELTPIEYIDSKNILCRTHYFLCTAHDGELITEKPDDKLEWIAIDSVHNTLSYNNLKEYWQEHVLPNLPRKA